MPMQKPMKPVWKPYENHMKNLWETMKNPCETYENKFTAKTYDNPIKNPMKTSRILSVFTVHYAARSAAAKK